MLPLQKITVNGIARASSYGESEKGNTQLGVTFEVVDHEQYNGSAITAMLHFTDATAERSIESLMHMGWDGEELSDLAGLDEEGCAKLLPNVVQLVCEPEEYEGKWTLKVKWINRPGAGRFAFKKPLEREDLRAFSAQMRNVVRSVRAAGGAPRKSTQSAQPAQRPLPSQQQTRRQSPHPNAPAGWDDDLPF